ncbi:hypothetical protein PS631_04329 [Pseudomonas fluorescens]|uniref:Uncharacterized protein n=1 Tax=Pseudomonas fluorescens TaxID=294 RepID=A0A5E6VQD4_PSEFL|nr:hypothetical protein PS631_04329 [Pseudomonas fluorescens]
MALVAPLCALEASTFNGSNLSSDGNLLLGAGMAA